MRSLVSLLAGLWQRPGGSSPQQPAEPEPCHARATVEQGDWLEELDMLELGLAAQRSAQQRGGYDSETFDLMCTIADLLEFEHGWSAEQTQTWLTLMGVWEAEL